MSVLTAVSTSEIRVQPFGGKVSLRFCTCAFAIYHTLPSGSPDGANIR